MSQSAKVTGFAIRSLQAAQAMRLWPLAMALLAEDVLIAQSPKTSCPTCEIRARQVAQFDLPAKLLGEFNWPGAIAASDTRVYLSVATGPDVIALDHSGTVVATTVLPREGTRPPQVFALAMLSDTLFVGGVDGRGPFATSVAPDGSFGARRDIAGLPRALVPLRGGTVVFNAQIPSRERAGLALHASILGRTDVQSFKLVPPDSSPLSVLVAAAAGGVWTAPVTTFGAASFAIERWSVAGERLQSLPAASDWLRYEIANGRPTGGPPPSVYSLRDDGRGILWLLGRVQRTDWQRAADQAGEVLLKDRRYDLQYDSMIEVYDLRDGVFLGRQRVHAYGVVLGPNGLLVALRRTSDNRLRVVLWRLELVGR